MCCRACVGYETCPRKTDLAEDCCTRCRYYEDSMESNEDNEPRQHSNASGRKHPKSRK